MAIFSPHRFWDTAVAQIDIGKHQAWLVKRVLEKSLCSDWQLLLLRVGKQMVRQAVRNIPNPLPDRIGANTVVLSSGIGFIGKEIAGS
jgi:hypothetical protein